MILYSVTFNIDHDVHDEWLRWMQQKHVPTILATGLFVDNKILRLLNEYDNGGVTYSFQYYLKSMEDYIRYENDFAPHIQGEHIRRYDGKFVTFQTLLEIVE